MEARVLGVICAVTRAGLGVAILIGTGCSEPRELQQTHASECSGCHGNAMRTIVNEVVEAKASSILLRAAPPFDTEGNAIRSARGVGAHLAHINAGLSHPAFTCNTCHPGVDESVTVHENRSDIAYVEQHIDGMSPIVLSGTALSGGRQSTFSVDTLTCSASWCHGPEPVGITNASPTWTSTVALGCTGCHGNPPALPHPQVDNCALCHGKVFGGQDGHVIVSPLLHVNGTIEVQSQSCNGGCHGSLNSPAPPSDLAGNASSTVRGVGAHQVHLNTMLGRKVECGDCHLVPSLVSDWGHLDSTIGAEVTFSPLASGGSVKPNWNGISCNNVYCHNPTAAQSNSGGAIPEPVWTQSGQVTCGSCHSLPPPEPHPAVTGGCVGCHTNVTESLGFIDPTLHINGRVDF
jgi:predicted CxxxxCH...CXXCH cytochrome family protein